MDPDSLNLDPDPAFQVTLDTGPDPDTDPDLATDLLFLVIFSLPDPIECGSITLISAYDTKSLLLQN